MQLTHDSKRAKAAARQCKKQCDGDGWKFKAAAPGRLAVSCRGANIFCGRRGFSTFTGKNRSFETSFHEFSKKQELPTDSVSFRGIWRAVWNEAPSDGHKKTADAKKPIKRDGG
jgi:hypothetical protein